jgi:catechol 2,3-dioxygenase-like lactoylglutathione lyase family enzyme
MITGLHTIIYSDQPEEARAFIRDLLGFRATDAGGGWLLYAMPPAELAVHPAEEGGTHELHLMCDDLDPTMAELRAKGVEFTRPVSEQSWGRSTALKIPGGGEIGLYEPRHHSAHSS